LRQPMPTPRRRRWAAERALGRLALALAGALALVLAAVPLALLVRSAWPPLTDADEAVTRAAEDAVTRSDLLLALARAVTLAGDPALTWVLVLVVAAVLLRRGFARLALFLVVARAGAQLLSTALKAAVDRARPVFDEPVDTALGGSFPSGHSLAAAAVWTALAVLAVPLVRGGWRYAVVAAAVLVAGAVAASRVLLGVHYVSDVVGGFVLGTGWTVVCAAVLVAWRADEGRRVDPLTDGVEPELATQDDTR
jgi:undecaprenyl-diphosphatase